MRFDNLRHGGQALADALQHYRAVDRAIVLGLVRGGMPAALEVARALDLPLDLIVMRPVFPREQFNPVRVSSVAGTVLLDDELTRWPAGSPSIEQIHAAQAIEELRLRTLLCRGERPPVDISARTVIVVDNGIRTSTSMQGAIRAVRRLQPAKVIAAVPVSDASRVDFVRGLVDEFVCLATPEPFCNAAAWYRKFDVPLDDRVASFLDVREAGEQ